MDRAIAWVARRTAGDLAALWVIEGVATYGARLAAAVDQAGYEMVEAARMDARAHRGTGKSDPLDARADRRRGLVPGACPAAPPPRAMTAPGPRCGS